MSAIIDRGTLITEFEAYAKRVFATDRQDVFVQITEDRIFRDTRAQENLTETTLIPTSTLIDLPADFIDMRELSFMNGARRIVLSSVGRHMFARFASRTGRQSVYSVMGGDPKQVEVAPTSLPDEFTLWYWQKLPPLVADTDTNVLLTTYPYLWLYGMLIEGNVFIQDDVARQRAQEFYSQELKQVNVRASESRFGEAPVLGAG
jgi:hypothetical protein